MKKKQDFEIDYPKDQSLRQFNGPIKRAFSNSMVNKDSPDFQSLFHKNQPITKNILKNLLMKHKVKKLTNNFVKKMRKNSIYRVPAQGIDSDNLDENKGQFLNNIKMKLNTIGQNQGIVLGNIALAVWSFVNIFQITIMVFIFSIMVTFPQTDNFQIFVYFRIFSVILYIIDMTLNFITQRYESGQNLKTFGEISGYYIKNGFFVDLISILIFPVDLLVDGRITIYISFVALIKLVNNLKKFEKFQYLYITTSQREQYYGLIKVFLMNFTIGHFLSIFLNLMAYIQSNNWLQKLQITDSQWYIKYIWGYYWGTNIMLTVGFGDLTATNHYEAIILIFIQTFSCITLAYNISYVGALIGSMKQNQESKKRKMKTFHKMCKQNLISSDTEVKITNFIEQSYRIKQTFEHDYEQEVMNFLPKSMQLDYRKQSNKILFDNLGFLKNLSKKSLMRLAESITRKICHPEEIIVRKGFNSDLIILRKGQLGFSCKNQSLIDGRIIETLSVTNQQENNKPKIFSLDFIKNKTIKFNLKSLSYSDLFYMSRQDFMEALRNSEMDYQLFCMLKDRQEYIQDENQLYKCVVCKNQYHNKFKCPRLHYQPFKQLIIIKTLRNQNKRKQKRQKFNRAYKYVNTTHYKPLIEYKVCKDEQKQFLKVYYDDDSYDKVQDLMDFYFKIQIGETLKKNKTITNPQNINRKMESLQNKSNDSQSIDQLSSQKQYDNTKNQNQIKNMSQFFMPSIIQSINQNRNTKNHHINTANLNFNSALALKSQILSKKLKQRPNNVQTLIQQLLLDKRIQLQTNFWEIQTDLAHNFKYYFKHNNAELITAQKKGYFKKKMMFGLDKIFN